MKKSDFKILVVDDADMVREVIIKFLSDEGYSVVGAGDGLSAIKILKLEDIKLVITDLRMPGADGIEVLKNAIKINPKIAVVIVTAYGTLDTALEVMKEGAYDYILKPFKMQELLIVVRNAYDRALLINENEELSNHLRETYRNLEVIKTLSSSKDVSITLDCLERIERLKELKIIDATEAKILKERFISGGAEGKDINSR